MGMACRVLPRCRAFWLCESFAGVEVWRGRDEMGCSIAAVAWKCAGPDFRYLPRTKTLPGWKTMGCPDLYMDFQPGRCDGRWGWRSRPPQVDEEKGSWRVQASPPSRRSMPQPSVCRTEVGKSVATTGMVVSPFDLDAQWHYCGIAHDTRDDDEWRRLVSSSLLISAVEAVNKKGGADNSRNVGFRGRFCRFCDFNLFRDKPTIPTALFVSVPVRGLLTRLEMCSAMGEGRGRQERICQWCAASGRGGQWPRAGWAS